MNSKNVQEAQEAAEELAAYAKKLARRTVDNDCRENVVRLLQGALTMQFVEACWDIKPEGRSDDTAIRKSSCNFVKRTVDAFVEELTDYAKAVGVDGDDCASQFQPRP